ncbi:hypothetical protein SUNI508_05642 [Seiridium unicorne]|uniref:2EXR domain-containing protein n=1 Tax=Seiridium unicorne TaxID=138068 RepID=A0ABR2V3G1_9PEZI
MDAPTEFHLFPKLAPEIQEMIWREALPTRYIYPRAAGVTWVPEPPGLTRVCRISRGVALRYGGPYAIDKYEKRPSSCWFTPSQDIVLYTGSRTPKVPPHPILEKALWDDVRSIVVYDEWLVHTGYYSNSLVKDAIRFSASRPQLKEIMVWPFMPTGSTLRCIRPRETWFSAFDDLFGKDSVKVVDLGNTKMVKEVVATLCTDDSLLGCARVLNWSQKLYRDEISAVKNWWAKLETACQVTWLQARFDVAKERAVVVRKTGNSVKKIKKIKKEADTTVPVKVMEPAEIDMENIWIRETLKQMPKLRPVVLLVSKEDSCIPYVKRRKRQKDDPKPTIEFNDEFKLWQKTRTKAKTTK